MIPISTYPPQIRPVLRSESDEATLTTNTQTSVSVSKHKSQNQVHADCWLSAGGKLGEIYLGIFSDTVATNSQIAGDAISLALSIQRMEKLIQAFEDWLGVAFDLLPAHELSDSYKVQIEFTAKDNPLVHGVLVMGVESISVLTQPTQSITQSCSLKWNSLPFHVQLSQAAISLSQLNAIETGGIYLLTESFRADWFCDVRIEGKSNIKFRFKIMPDGMLQVVDQYKSIAEDMVSDCSGLQKKKLEIVSVEQVEPILIPVNSLLQSSEYSVLDFKDKIFDSLVYLQHAESKLAAGKVIPVSHGYAVLIEELFLD